MEEDEDDDDDDDDDDDVTASSGMLNVWKMDEKCVEPHINFKECREFNICGSVHHA